MRAITEKIEHGQEESPLLAHFPDARRVSLEHNLAICAETWLHKRPPSAARVGRDRS